MAAPGDVTQALTSVRRGDGVAADQLVSVVYEELRGLAARHLRRERRDHTLQPTALAHEAYLRLVDQTRVDWKDRAHFLAIAAEMIRRILVDHARRRAARKRGGGLTREYLADADEAVGVAEGIDLVALDEALDRLESRHRRQRRIVELRFFGGLTIDETAEVLGISATKVKVEWQMARAWLRQHLER